MNYRFSGSVWRAMHSLAALFILVCSWSAQATAPRIAPQLFGEEQKADIVAYQFSPFDAPSRSESELAVEIVTQAYKAEGKTPKIDVLPSKQLASYALFNNDVAALLGNAQDFAAKDKSRYRVVTFYFRADEPVLLIFSKARGNELHKAFNEGLQKILKNGKYLEILEKYHVKVPEDYAGRLKRHNPGWK